MQRILPPNPDSAEYSSTLPLRNLPPYLPYLPYAPPLPALRLDLRYPTYLAPTGNLALLFNKTLPSIAKILTLLNVTPAVPTTHTLSIPYPYPYPFPYLHPYPYLCTPRCFIQLSCQLHLRISTHLILPPTSHKQHIRQHESYTPLRHPTPKHPPNHNGTTQPLHREIDTHYRSFESLCGPVSNISISFAARSHILGPIVSISHRQSDIPCHLIFNTTADIHYGTL